MIMKIEKIINKIKEETKSLEALQRKPSYTAIVLYEREHNKLLNAFDVAIPEGWEKITHHVTINMGSWKGDPGLIGSDFSISVEGCYGNKLVLAAKVLIDESIFHIAKPHITIAVNRLAGGKPAMSNQLDFSSEPVSRAKEVVFGKLVEVMQGDNKFAEGY